MGFLSRFLGFAEQKFDVTILHNSPVFKSEHVLVPNYSNKIFVINKSNSGRLFLKKITVSGIKTPAKVSILKQQSNLDSIETIYVGHIDSGNLNLDIEFVEPLEVFLQILVSVENISGINSIFYMSYQAVEKHKTIRKASLDTIQKEYTSKNIF